MVAGTNGSAVVEGAASRALHHGGPDPRCKTAMITVNLNPVIRVELAECLLRRSYSAGCGRSPCGGGVIRARSGGSRAVEAGAADPRSRPWPDPG
jgi:hypothetical protein